MSRSNKTTKSRLPPTLAGLLSDLLFDPLYAGDIFLLNVGFPPNGVTTHTLH
jgi:hypothetical protein